MTDKYFYGIATFQVISSDRNCLALVR